MRTTKNGTANHAADPANASGTLIAIPKLAPIASR